MSGSLSFPKTSNNIILHLDGKSKEPKLCLELLTLFRKQNYLIPLYSHEEKVARHSPHSQSPKKPKPFTALSFYGHELSTTSGPTETEREFEVVKNTSVGGSSHTTKKR